MTAVVRRSTRAACSRARVAGPRATARAGMARAGRHSPAEPTSPCAPSRRSTPAAVRCCTRAATSRPRAGWWRCGSRAGTARAGRTCAAEPTGSTTPSRALCVFDDGTGPALYAGGAISRPRVALLRTTSPGGTARAGPRWGGVDSFVRALTVFDGGGGPALYAGGLFLSAGARARAGSRAGMASWSPLGTGMPGFRESVSAHGVRQRQRSRALPGGSFTSAGGVSTSRMRAGTARAGRRSAVA